MELGASWERPKLDRWKDSSDHGNRGGAGGAKLTQAFGKQRQDPRQREAWRSQGLRDKTLVSRIGISLNFIPGQLGGKGFSYFQINFEVDLPSCTILETSFNIPEPLFLLLFYKNGGMIHE